MQKEQKEPLNHTLLSAKRTAPEHSTVPELDCPPWRHNPTNQNTSQHKDHTTTKHLTLLTCEPAAALLIRLLLGWEIQKVETALQGIFLEWLQH